MSGTPTNQRLPVLVNTDTNERFTLSSENLTIGRAPEHGIVLPNDGFVSANHAKIYWDSGWWIEDLMSSNGTYVNSEVVSDRRKLAPNDLIKIGRTTFRIE
jgi:pSer/pThr/pTyr-binding forkhead associated (FHA) protein